MYSVLRTFGDTETKLRDEINDVHVRPQWDLIRGFRIDFLGVYDSLESDWRLLQRRYDLDDLPHLHKGRHRPKGRWADFDWDKFPEYRKDLEMIPQWLDLPPHSRGLLDRPGDTKPAGEVLSYPLISPTSPRV